MDPVRVFVGTEPRQYIPQLVLGDSIRRNTKSPLEIKFCTQDQKRVGGTKFGFVRYMAPSYCDFRGKAIYLDADMVVLRDINELWNSLPEDASLNVVQQPEGFYGDKPAEPGNYTSVMVLRCDRLKAWDPNKLFNNVVPNTQPLKDGEIHYRDFMTLKWFDPSQIAPLDPRWNHLNIVRDDTCLVHFTHVRSQPWRKPSHPLSKVWEEQLRIAMSRGAVKRTDVVKAVLKGHMHPYFLRVKPGK